MIQNKLFSGTLVAISALALIGATTVGCGSSSDDGETLTNPGGTPAGGSAGEGGAGGNNAGGSAGATGGSAGATGGSAGATGGSAGATGGSAGATGGSAGATGGAAGATGGAAGATGGAAGATGGAAGAGGTCSDPLDEPNNTKDTATGIDNLSCGKKSSYKGIMGLSTDADWLAFDVKEAIMCTHKPAAQVDLATARVCLFLDCKKGSTELTCKTGTAENADGLDGCCATGEKVEIKYDCKGGGFGSNDDAHAFIRVDQPGHNDCKAYKLDYSY